MAEIPFLCPLTRTSNDEGIISLGSIVYSLSIFFFSANLRASAGLFISISSSSSSDEDESSSAPASIWRYIALGMEGPTISSYPALASSLFKPFSSSSSYFFTGSTLLYLSRLKLISIF